MRRGLGALPIIAIAVVAGIVSGALSAVAVANLMDEPVAVGDVASPSAELDPVSDVRINESSAVIEAAGGGPVTAIGISKSGNMLVRLAVTAPALVKRLVLIGTPLDITPGSLSLVPSEVDDAFQRRAEAQGAQQR